MLLAMLMPPVLLPPCWAQLISCKLAMSTELSAPCTPKGAYMFLRCSCGEKALDPFRACIIS